MLAILSNIIFGVFVGLLVFVSLGAIGEKLSQKKRKKYERL